MEGSCLSSTTVHNVLVGSADMLLNGLRRMTAAKRTKNKMYLRFSETKGLHHYDIASFNLFVVRSIGIPRIHSVA